MLRRSEQLNDLAKALASAQGAMEAAKKDKNNPAFGKASKYADLASIWDAVREPLSKHGLSVVQLPFTDEQGRVNIATLLMHSSGQWIEASYALSPTKNDPQGFGSAITYMKRYALTGMGVAPEDDDGNAATGTTVSGGGYITHGTPPLDRPKQATNGNGHHAETAKRATAPKPEDEAKDWSDWATNYVKTKIKTASELRKWEQSNESGITNLKLLDRALWSDLNMLLEERHSALTAAQMSA